MWGGGKMWVDDDALNAQQEEAATNDFSINKSGLCLLSINTKLCSGLEQAARKKFLLCGGRGRLFIASRTTTRVMRDRSIMTRARIKATSICARLHYILRFFAAEEGLRE